MKTIATLALTPGMVTGSDVYSYRNEQIIPSGTSLTELDIKKLQRHNIMCVDIKEAHELATRTYEKIRLRDSFRHFEQIYVKNLDDYKSLTKRLLSKDTTITSDAFLAIHDEVMNASTSDSELLLMLYYMTPTEDMITYTHCFNSALIASIFGKWLSLSGDHQNTLVVSAFLYDIGKLYLPDKILWKPDKLSDFEYQWMKTHAEKGYELLKDLSMDEHIKNSALMHHEKSDGTGYPNHLKEQDIDPFARYIAIIDTYEAMTSARAYRQSKTPFAVIEAFEGRGFEHFDQYITRPIMDNLAKLQIGMTYELSDHSTGSILAIHQDHLSRPLIARQGEELDLRDHPQLQLVSIV